MDMFYLLMNEDTFPIIGTTRDALLQENVGAIGLKKTQQEQKTRFLEVRLMMDGRVGWVRSSVI